MGTAGTDRKVHEPHVTVETHMSEILGVENKRRKMEIAKNNPKNTLFWKQNTQKFGFIPVDYQEKSWIKAVMLPCHLWRLWKFSKMIDSQIFAVSRFLLFRN